MAEPQPYRAPAPAEAACFRYRLVRLSNGGVSIRSVAEGETFHPVIGPAAEAQALYVNQFDLEQRLARQQEPFVVWDVGLGAAANSLALLRASARAVCPVRILSFDHTLEPLRFGLQHAGQLGYFQDFEEPLHALLRERRVRFNHGRHLVEWEVHVADFPTLLAGREAVRWPKPHAIFYDAYSPVRNPEMWTLPLFARLYELLDPHRSCAMATYSRSTMLRVTLLCAGFFVGAGRATGEKEETTVAANTHGLVAAPLDRHWLARARRSTSAEPLRTPDYRQARLSEETWERLLQHPQFQGL